MEQINKLTRLLKREIPSASVAVDAPAKTSGNWFVDVRSGGQAFTIEFRPASGFGLSSVDDESGYGEGPDEFFVDDSSVVARLRQLLRAHRRTEPDRVRFLQELRARRNVAQTTVAAKLGIRQPTVSKIERREDLSLGTLRRFVEALGGELRVTARFADGAVEIGPRKKSA
jgi:DNA-binding Xre family transcriptional regulator